MTNSLTSEFNALVEQYDNTIRRICFGYARSAAEFEDLRQDVLVNIWQGLPRFRRESEIKTWIYRVTLNTCVSTLRQRKKHPDEYSLYELVDVADESAQTAERLRELHEGIAQLGPLDKAVVLLWLEEYSYEEIASMVGLKRNAVAVRLHRAKEKLKNIF